MRGEAKPFHPAEPFNLTPEDLPVEWRLPVYQPAGGSGNIPVELGLRAIMDDFLVNDDTVGGYNEQNLPAVARGPAGNFVIAWMDWRGCYPDVYAQRYDPSGTPVGTNFKVNEGSVPGSMVRSQIDAAMDSSNNFVIAWIDFRRGFPKQDLYAQRYDSAGTPLGPNFRVNNEEIDWHPLAPAIDADRSGNFVIVWMNQRNGNWDIYAQRYDPAGTPIGSNFKVNDDTMTASQWDPAIAMDRTGNFVITWDENRNGNDDWDIYAQRYNSSGVPLDSNFKVNDSSPGWQFSATIAADGSGNFVIAWINMRNLWHPSGIYAQRYNSSGTPLDSNFKVNDDTTGVFDESQPAAASDGSGNFVITWMDEDLVHVYAQRFDSSGNPLGANFKVREDTSWFSVRFPAIASDNSGNFVITWADGRNGRDMDIYAQMYDSAGNSLGTNFRVGDDFGVATQRYPAIDANESGNFVVVWYDEREQVGMYSDIYAQRYASTGMPAGFNFKVSDNAVASIDYGLATAMDYYGNFVITWSAYSRIYAQRYDSSGTPIDTNFRVDDNTVSDTKWSPDISSSAFGNFVIAWMDHRDPDHWDIYAQRYDSHGNPLGANFWVGSGYYSAVAADHRGNFVVVWDTRNLDVWDIFAQRYDSSGTPIGPTFKVNDDAGVHDQWYPDIAMDCTGNFVITFSDTRNHCWEIYAQRYNSSGISLGPNFKVADGTGAFVPYGGRVAMDCSGNFVVTWMDYNVPDVYARRFDFSGNPVGEIFLVPNPDYVPFAQSYSAVAANNCNLYFAWQDNRRAKGWDIYANVKWSFHPPDAFSLRSPRQKAFVSPEVHFDWDTATDPCPFDEVRYDLYVSTLYQFPPAQTDIDSNLTASEFSKELDYKVYYWKVKAKDNWGAERWSKQTRSVIVGGLRVIPIGDLNSDGSITTSDVVFLINYLYISGPSPDPLELGDVNCDDKVNTADVVFLINYLFNNGPSPSC